MTAAHGVLDMPHFDIVLHAVIPNLEPTLRKRLRIQYMKVETALRITFVDKNIFFQNKSFLSSTMRVAGNVLL